MESTEHKSWISVLNHSLLYCNRKSQHFRWGNSETSSVTSSRSSVLLNEWNNTVYFKHSRCFTLVCYFDSHASLMLQILMHKGKRSQFLYCSYMNYRGKRYETVSDVTTTNYRRGWAPPGCASSKCQKCVCAHHVLHTFTLFNHVLVKLYWPTRNIWHHAQCKFRCVETGEVFLSESSTDNWCAYNLKFVLEVGQ